MRLGKWTTRSPQCGTRRTLPDIETTRLDSRRWRTGKLSRGSEERFRRYFELGLIGMDLLDYFACVQSAEPACGRTLKEQQRVIIEDVEADPEFAPHRHIAASARFRAVQSTPLAAAKVRVVSSGSPQARCDRGRAMRCTFCRRGSARLSGWPRKEGRPKKSLRLEPFRETWNFTIKGHEIARSAHSRPVGPVRHETPHRRARTRVLTPGGHVFFQLASRSYIG